MSIMERFLDWIPKIMFTAAAVTISAIGYTYYTYYFQIRKEDLSIPKLRNANWIKIGRVEKLKMYPVAFGAELCRRSFQFTQDGMRMEDRGISIMDGMFKVYDEMQKIFRTYWDLNGLEKISLTVVDNATIEFNAPGMSPLNIIYEDIDKDPRTFEFMNWYEKKTILIDCGEEAATWLNRYLKTNTLRLLKTTYNPNEKDNLIEKHWQHYVRKHIMHNLYGKKINFAIRCVENIKCMTRKNKGIKKKKFVYK